MQFLISNNINDIRFAPLYSAFLVKLSSRTKTEIIQTHRINSFTCARELRTFNILSFSL